MLIFNRTLLIFVLFLLVKHTYGSYNFEILCIYGKNYIISYYDGLNKTEQRALEQTLNEAVREAINDETFRKVRRLSYGQHGPEQQVF